MDENEFLALLRPLATDPAARGLADDAAVLGDLVFTHDMIVEGVHFRAHDAPGDVAWKLLGVNLSDLAAKGAVPIGVLLGFPLGDPDWDRAFVSGLGGALAHYGVPLLGGDTVAGPRVLSMTAIGRSAHAPPRGGANPYAEGIYVTGVIGRAGLGLAGDPAHADAYLRPRPRLTEGLALAPHVSSMMDISDGLLIDLARMQQASGCDMHVFLDKIPIAGELWSAITAGDDYELLFTMSCDAPPVPATWIGYTADNGEGLVLWQDGERVALPKRLGWQHQKLASRGAPPL